MEFLYNWCDYWNTICSIIKNKIFSFIFFNVIFFRYLFIIIKEKEKNVIIKIKLHLKIILGFIVGFISAPWV